MQAVYRIDRQHAKLCRDDAIYLGLRTFGEQAQEMALFRVWCALQISDHIDRKLPNLKHHSLQAALKGLEGLEWIVLDDENGVIKIIV